METGPLGFPCVLGAQRVGHAWDSYMNNFVVSSCSWYSIITIIVMPIFKYTTGWSFRHYYAIMSYGSYASTFIKQRRKVIKTNRRFANKQLPHQCRVKS